MAAQGYYFDPFGARYYNGALHRAKKLRGRDAQGRVGRYDIVARLGNSDAEVLIGRRADGSLWVLKGRPPSRRIGNHVMAGGSTIRGL